MTEWEDCKHFVFFTLNLTENENCKCYDWYEYERNCKPLNALIHTSEYCKPTFAVLITTRFVCLQYSEVIPSSFISLQYSELLGLYVYSTQKSFQAVLYVYSTQKLFLVIFGHTHTFSNVYSSHFWSNSLSQKISCLQSSDILGHLTRSFLVSFIRSC